MDSFRHEAAYYRGLDGLVDTVAPFVREGVQHGEPVMVALLPDRLEALQHALGPDAGRVDYIDMAEVGRNPARIIPEWRRFVDDSAHRGPFRGVGEPIWFGRRDVEIAECRLHEALLNVAFDDGPAWQLMCPYDQESLPRSVIEDAMRTHPVLNTDRGAAYEGQHGAVEEFSTWLPDPPEWAQVFEFGGDDLAGLRGIVGRMAGHAGLTQERREDLVLAAHELAANSITHGGGSGVLRAWTESEAFVIDISDAGKIVDPLVGRDLTLGLSESGRGVWMANQLCDLVQVRSNLDGTDVRLYSWL